MNTTDGHPKVFGVGLNKTGTTTFAECGKILGLRCTSVNRELLEDFVLRNDFTRIKEKVSQFDLFEDWPWPLLYKELDQMFPESKFILTVRKSEDVWFESLRKHSMRTHPRKHCRKLAYGFNYPEKREREHKEFYRRHNDNVREYFKDRSGDFIELCWENGDGFEKLCNFLDCNVPDDPLPNANKAVNLQPKKSWLLMNRVLSFMSH